MSTGMTIYERAAQLWPLLVYAARNQQVLSYRMIEELTGLAKLGIGNCLGPIQDHCKANEWPPLTSLVIKEETGLPGIGFTEAQGMDVFKAQARVFVFDWASKAAPSASDFKAIVSSKSAGVP